MATVFMLLAEYETGDIPLEIIVEKYFGMSRRQMCQWAREQRFPFPVFRIGSQKSRWFVDIKELSVYLTELKRDSRQRFELMNGYPAVKRNR